MGGMGGLLRCRRRRRSLEVVVVVVVHLKLECEGIKTTEGLTETVAVVVWSEVNNGGFLWLSSSFKGPSWAVSGRLSIGECPRCVLEGEWGGLEIV